jgi:hypothetical protein
MKKLILLILIVFSTFVFSQTKKKNSQTSSLISCHYCGKKFNRNNGYVVPLGTTTAKPYKLVMENIVLARQAGYSEKNLQTYLLGIKRGEYYCSQKCTRLSGYTIENF